jgi:hypothetical protein
MEISSFLGFHDTYSTDILSCWKHWNHKFKPKIDGCSEEDWTLKEVIICITW